MAADPLFIKSHQSPLRKTVCKDSTLLPKGQVSNVKLLSLSFCNYAVLGWSSNHSLPNPLRINKLRNNPTTVRAMNMKTLTTPIITRNYSSGLRYCAATGTNPNRSPDKNTIKHVLNCIEMSS
ncbi:hypothetical protein GX563_00370 [Candidatus Bathyarchaeota archaeon]|nr:hypothetical protein [Candidatus Bathyarchaeota archaeon]